MATPTYRSALYRAMQTASDKAGTAVRATFSRNIASLTSKTSLASIQRGLVGGVNGAVKAIDWLSFEKGLREEYERRLIRAMKSGSAEFQKKFKVKFDPDDPFVKKTIKQQARQLSSQLARETKRGFKQAAKGLIKEGAGRRNTAKVLKDTIGLTRKEAQSVINTRKAALDKGLKRNKINSASSKLTQKLRRRRGTRIARTAGNDIASLGQNTVLKSAIRSGIIEKDDVERVWIISPGACPICEPMAGQVRAPGKDFVTGEGDSVDGPTVHPNCNCSVIVRIKK